jgi:hypothetical protein
VERLNDTAVQLNWFGGEGERAVDIVWCRGKPRLLQCQVHLIMVDIILCVLDQISDGYGVFY